MFRKRNPVYSLNKNPKSKRLLPLEFPKQKKIELQLSINVLGDALDADLSYLIHMLLMLQLEKTI